MSITPERLAAYADDQLEAGERLTVEAALERHHELRAQVEAHRRLRARLSAHFDRIAEKPVPDQLIAAVSASAASPEPIDFASERVRRKQRSIPHRWIYLASPALAASLMLVVLSTNMLKSDRYASGALGQALDTQLVANQPADAPVRILLSFEHQSGQFCRAYAATRQAGIACRDDNGWLIRKSIEASVEGSAEYRQAGSASEELMRQIQAMAKGPALDAVAELDARARGWRN
jgi:hypothetical protein